ncbi:MAG: M6 family metalloprotease domain-containing protein [Candidatus Cloacimonetes bacterium]|nr:M6 family metalloprotease domain-containing protein [Candidatus Cloacimonadota bacterium]MDD2507307.1 M6 family metalloprotease domain-containing protein [Candidatus Cloacimonadota bacterium]MDD4560721.1 M6 family metalloprotease domain-containing protein [Candidatus Cloacimonadota bacterium]
MRHTLTIFFCLLVAVLTGANLYNVPSSVTQPDGSELHLLASGDEYANRLHDSLGYTIIQSPDDGYYYYAELRDGEPVPSVHRADSSDPRSLGLTPGIKVSRETYYARKQAMNAHNRKGNRGPNTGTVNNLVVYIRFSDQTEFEQPRSFFDAKFNEEGEDAYSLRNYFQQVSYNQLNYVSHHYPTCEPQTNLSYQDSHPRSYYMPYHSLTCPDGFHNDIQRTEREHTLLANAISYIASQVPPFLNIDADNDGKVDNVCFIIRGPHTAWAELLWAHRWVLYNSDAFIHGKQVWDYTFQTEDHNDVCTLCHEMFHSVGAPDLYHYEHDGLAPAGCWDIMESGYCHMGMYMKYRYGGWIDSIPELAMDYTATLNPVTSPTNNCFKVNIANSSEFLVLEYRKKGSDIFEAELPGSGLLIYRINPTLDGNSEGPPDEVFIFRPNGSNIDNGLLAEATFSLEEYRTEFNEYTNPQACFSDGSPMGVNIMDIGCAAETISFRRAITGEVAPPAIHSLLPAAGSFVPNSSFQVSAEAVPSTDILERVEFYLDGVFQGQVFSAPYSMLFMGEDITPGAHEISVKAWSTSGVYSTKGNQITIIDPGEPNWFDWVTENPEWEAWGRGVIPIKVAVEMDLGDQEYRVNALRFQMVPDPWGEPDLPGLVEASVHRFADGAITDEVILDLGYFFNFDYTPDFTYAVHDTTSISGHIAVIIDLYEYQNIVFDNNAISGHTWITETGRPWTDALGRGIIGAADIRLLLQDPTSGMGHIAVPSAGLNLSIYPNPFCASTEIKYNLKDSAAHKISIYNLKGQLVRTLVQDKGRSGMLTAIWDGKDDKGRNAASGIYFCHLSSGKQSATQRMVLIK